MWSLVPFFSCFPLLRRIPPQIQEAETFAVRFCGRHLFSLCGGPSLSSGTEIPKFNLAQLIDHFLYVDDFCVPLRCCCITQVMKILTCVFFQKVNCFSFLIV